MGYVAFVLDEVSRTKILQTYKPKYPDVIAHHVTLEFGVNEEVGLQLVQQYTNALRIVEVIGYSDHIGMGEVLVVAINNNVGRRDPTNLYHITLSIDRSKGVKPKDSNDILRSIGWSKSTPIVLTGTVKYIK